ncbi:MAG: hypothetical protein OHK0024_00150 [Thalassobaculales bacterium]
MVDGLGEAGGWVEVASLGALAAKGRLVVRPGGRQIALFWHGGRVLACANRCPHEGYPLREGTLDGDCVLTCNWHNWKFSLTTGANLMNGEPVRVYPVELRDGAVFLDLTDPPAEARRAKVLEGLVEAVADNAYDRIARELARYEKLGGDGLDGLAAAIAWSHDRFEFGMTHAYAAAADWLVLRGEAASPEDRLACLTEAIGHIADDVWRAGRFAFAEAALPWDEAAFLAAMEAEDEAAAVSRLRGALAAGMGFAALEGALARAALAHYADFGHSLIYVQKAGALIAALGDRVAGPVLLALLRSIVMASREDRIPEFRHYASALAEFGGPGAVPDAAALRGLAIRPALAAVAANGGAAPLALYDVLLTANAVNMLTYDDSYQFATDRPLADNVGWLDFTHGLTFAGAVRELAGRHPDLWPAGLLQMACFLGRNAPYTDAGAPVLAADPQAVLKAAVARLYDHGVGEYIISAHLVKTTLAVRREIADGRGDAGVMAAALQRFLAAPLKRRHARRTARQMLDFVAQEG